MAQVIAVAGKGGVGKTTLCGLLIQYLCEKGKTPVLAVDADANSNLNEVLGVEVEMTLGEVREQIENAANSAKSPIPPSMSKADYAEIMMNRCLVEEDDYDMLVMGRTQGKGCYCFVNGLLQAQVQKLTPNDCSRRGVQAVGRIAGLVKECGLNPKQIGLIVNRAPEGKLNDGTKEEIEKQGLTLFGVVPQDQEVYEYDCDGKPMTELPENAAVKTALYKILDSISL